MYILRAVDGRHRRSLDRFQRICRSLKACQRPLPAEVTGVSTTCRWRIHGLLT
ncbi:MAG: hypothetical protein MZV63_62675 [Marinilabiliales bacterium]|nr:hypothetical protein [Marinilabiliales bacterium]